MPADYAGPEGAGAELRLGCACLSAELGKEDAGRGTIAVKRSGISIKTVTSGAFAVMMEKESAAANPRALTLPTSLYARANDKGNTSSFFYHSCVPLMKICSITAICFQT